MREQVVNEFWQLSTNLNFKFYLNSFDEISNLKLDYYKERVKKK